MRRSLLLLALWSLAVLMACGLTLVALEEAEVSAQTPQKPNIVFILADDLRYDDFSYMPKTRALIGSQGATFSRAYVPLGICCPSRASILTGMYTHNHKVWFNENGANGGWQGFKSQGHERDNLATRLRGAGYRTGLFGKYLNDYDGSSVPRGWDDWFGKYEGYYYNWGANDNGTKVHYGRAEDDYSTDVIAGEARHFVGASVAADKPFFAYVSPVAPTSRARRPPGTCASSTASRGRGSHRSTKRTSRTSRASSGPGPAFRSEMSPPSMAYTRTGSSRCRRWTTWWRA